MERKYYLRGLGIGIAVTAIIMGIALAGDKTMTDDEIIARARELGMVENTVLTNSDDKTDKEENADAHDKTDDTGDNVQGAPESTASDDVTAVENGAVEEETDGDIVVPADTTDLTGDEQAAAETGEKPGESDAEQAEPGTPDGAVEAGTDNEAPEEAENRTEDNRNGNVTAAAVKTITINHGDGSYTVARKLADVGVVMSADTFDSFLCQNGYDKRLRTGTFLIPADASDEQIARIVTGAE